MIFELAPSPSAVHYFRGLCAALPLQLSSINSAALFSALFAGALSSLQAQDSGAAVAEPGAADPGKSVFEVKSSRTSPLAGGSGWRVTLREVKPMAWPPLPTAEVLCYDFSPLPGPGACWPNASPAWFSCSLAGCSDNFPEWPVFSPLCMRDKPPRKLYGTAALPCSPSKN